MSDNQNKDEDLTSMWCNRCFVDKLNDIEVKPNSEITVLFFFGSVWMITYYHLSRTR